VIAPGAASSALADILQPGEKIIWTGRPDPVATLRTQIFWWWLGVPALAFVVALHTADVIPTELHVMAYMIALVFLAAPLLMVVQAYGTVYAVTDRRVIIRHDALGRRQLVSYTLAQLDDALEILPTGDNTGHLYFASGAKSKIAYADYTGKVAFRELRDPEKIAALIAQTRNRATAA
jgi:hypothetical protein